MKQAVVLLQQGRAGNAEHFGMMDSAVQGLQEQAAVAGACGTTSALPLISLAQWQENLERMVAVETETRELRATLDQLTRTSADPPSCNFQMILLIPGGSGAWKGGRTMDVG